MVDEFGDRSSYKDDDGTEVFKATGDGDIPTVTSQDGEIVTQCVNVLRKKLLNEAETWKWKYYGKYKFCCGSLFMIPPTRFWWWIFMLATFSVGVTFLFEIEKYSLWVGGFGMLIFVLCIISTVKTTFVNPGIIKRPNLEEALMNLKMVEELMMYGICPPVVKIKINGKRVPHGYCKKCHLFRPPYSGHCNICDCCILDWNRHCDMTGGCIGERNWIWSQLMGLSYTVFYIFMLVGGAVAVSSQYQGGAFFLSNSIVVIEILLIIIGIFVIACVLFWAPESKEDKLEMRKYDRFPPLDVPAVQHSLLDFMPDDIDPFSVSEYGKMILQEAEEAGDTNKLYKNFNKVKKELV